MTSFPVYLITGLSGAGKSQAIQAFEDMGFYCVDNLPSEMVEEFVDHCQERRRDFAGVAMVIDVREGDFVNDFPGLIEDLQRRNLDLRTIFLEASSEALLNRYKESRRPHPLGANYTLKDAIETERERLDFVRKKADTVIDTTRMTSHQFRGMLIDRHHPSAGNEFTISLTSFGFKHGVPDHVDTLFDARFLDNPYYNDELKDLSGLDRAVREFFEEVPSAQEYLETLKTLLDQMVEGYSDEGKKHLSVAIGCTGGQHRSVFLVDELSKYFEERSATRSVVTHRDMEPSEESGRGADQGQAL